MPRQQGRIQSVKKGGGILEGRSRYTAFERSFQYSFLKFFRKEARSQDN